MNRKIKAGKMFNPRDRMPVMFYKEVAKDFGIEKAIILENISEFAIMCMKGGAQGEQYLKYLNIKDVTYPFIEFNKDDFSYMKSDIEKHLKELEEGGTIITTSSLGKTWVTLTAFKNHQ